MTHQIISSHSEVYGAGELTILNNYFIKKIFDNDFVDLFTNSQKNTEYLKNSNDLLNSFKEYDKDKIILDKSPLNFEWIGFIKLLSNAKIIHCSRNLKDTALSIYKNVFDGSSFP